MFSFGSDPEFFLITEGKFKSAIGVLPDKEYAISKNGCYYYYDNVLAEAQLKPVFKKEELIKNVKDCLDGLICSVPSFYKISLGSAAHFDEGELSHPKAKEINCVPEWDVYTLNQNLPPQEVMFTSLRTAGGHIHLGDKSFFQKDLNIVNVIRMMDLFLAIPSILLDKDKTAKERRKVYGHPGTHRKTEINDRIEYRTLSNFWLASPDLVEFIYDVCSFVLDFVKDNGHEKFWSFNEEFLCEEDNSLIHKCFGYDVELLKKTIIHCDKKVATKFMFIVKNYWPDTLIKKFDSLENQEFSLYKEWDLN